MGLTCKGSQVQVLVRPPNFPTLLMATRAIDRSRSDLLCQLCVSRRVRSTSACFEVASQFRRNTLADDRLASANFSHLRAQAKAVPSTLDPLKVASTSPPS